MFNKKSCKNCGEKINSKSNFCSACGYPLNNKTKDSDYGMLGRNDSPESNEIDALSNSLFGGFGGKLFGKMVNSTMKMLEKEMEKNIRESRGQNSFNNPNPNFELYINGKRVNPANIKVSKVPKVVKKSVHKNSANLFFSKNKKDDFMALEKVSPKTNLKRLSDRVIYEVSLPGVKSLDNVSIVKLESSIEIKAVSRSQAYEKIIPVGMNLDNYYLDNETLVLEMVDSQNL